MKVELTLTEGGGRRSHPNLFKKKKLKEKFTTTHIKIYTQRNSEFNNYKQYKFLNITKKI